MQTQAETLLGLRADLLGRAGGAVRARGEDGRHRSTGGPRTVAELDVTRIIDEFAIRRIRDAWTWETQRRDPPGARCSCRPQPDGVGKGRHVWGVDYRVHTDLVGPRPKGEHAGGTAVAGGVGDTVPILGQPGPLNHHNRGAQRTKRRGCAPEPFVCHPKVEHRGDVGAAELDLGCRFDERQRELRGAEVRGSNEGDPLGATRPKRRPVAQGRPPPVVPSLLAGVSVMAR